MGQIPQALGKEPFSTAVAGWLTRGFRMPGAWFDPDEEVMRSLPREACSTSRLRRAEVGGRRRSQSADDEPFYQSMPAPRPRTAP